MKVEKQDSRAARQDGHCRRLAVFPLLALLLLFLSVIGCSSEGGVVGTGISSLQGNVIDVQLDGGTSGFGGGSGGSAGTVPVLVSIDGTELETTTDVDGYFALSGALSGAVTVRFSDLQNRELLGTLVVEIAPGATVFLRDVEIRRDLEIEQPVIVGEPLHLNLAGTLSDVDCGGGTVAVTTDPPQRKAFMLRLTAATELVDTRSKPLGCTDLVRGNGALLEEGLVDPGELGIRVVRLVVSSGKHPPRQDEIRVVRRGVVLRTECTRGRLMHLLDSRLDDLVRVELGEMTRLDWQGHQRCTCADIRLGHFAEVRGVRRLARPDSIVAERVYLEDNPAPFLERTVTADVATIDCAAGAAKLLDVRLADPMIGELPSDLPLMDVTLLPTTVYLCGGRNPHPCACEDVGRRYRVELDARVPLAGGSLLARVVRVIAAPRASLQGDVQSIDCQHGWTVVRTRAGDRVAVKMSAATRIRDGTRVPVSCLEVAPGQAVRVGGTALERSDLVTPAILADEILVESS